MIQTDKQTEDEIRALRHKLKMALRENGSLRETLRTVRRALECIAHRTDSTATREDAIQGMAEIDRMLSDSDDTES